MKKHGFRNWVFQRIETQRKLTFMAAVGMAVVGTVFFILQAGFLLFAFLMAGYSLMTAVLVIAGLYSVMGLYTWSKARTELQDARHRAVSHSTTVELSIAPPTSHIWAWAFGSIDSDQSLLEWLTSIVMIVPRLFCAAWYTWQRLDDVHCIDEESTLEVMKVLFRSEHAVRPVDIQDAIQDDDLVKAIRDVSLLDGVVFLTKDEVTISIAPRLSEDLDAWRKRDVVEDSLDSVSG